MSIQIAQPGMARLGQTHTGPAQGATAATPAGQSQPMGAPVLPSQPVLDQPFMSFRPQLAPAQTAGLFSSDPAIQALLNNPDVDIETIILVQMALNNKQLDTLNASKAKDIDANRQASEKNQAERVKQIQASKEKVEAAANKGWWAKLLDVVGDAATFIGSAAVLVAAILAAPATGGLSIGVAVLAVYMMVGSATELANKAHELRTGERLFNFQITVGELAGLVAGAFGASDEVKQWIKLGVDVVVGVAAMFIIPGAQLNAFGKILKAGAAIVGGIAQISKGGLEISKAIDVRDLANTQASLDTLQAQIDRLTQNNQQLMDMLKLFQESKTDNENTVSEALEAKATTGRRIVMA
jgi:hypothetical protein